MEIKPQKNYKKPAFAIGLASLMSVSGTLTGCTNEAKNSSDTNKSGKDETSYLESAGDIAISTDSTTSLEYDGGLELVGEIEFDGAQAVPQETELRYEGEALPPDESVVEIDGDVVCPPDSFTE